MINQLDMPYTPPAPKRCDLLLHQGANRVSREEIKRTRTPRPTPTWQPIPHIQLLQIVEEVCSLVGLRITGESHGLTEDGARYFGLIELDHQFSGTVCVLGLRNAHDKRFSAGIVTGSQVLVCDNLSFLGEVVLARKHTTKILHELPSLVQEGMSKVSKHWEFHRTRIERYRVSPMGDIQAHDLLIRAVDHGVCANSYIPKVLHEWREPKHEEFMGRNLWSLQNAFTEVFKGRVDLLPERTQRLHRLLDEEVGLA